MTHPPTAADSHGNGHAWTVGWGFSARCDLACPFCYSRPAREPGQPEVELAWAAAFLQRNGSRISAVNFGTGECCLAPAFPDLLELCHRYAPGATLAVTTNGALADVAPNVLEAVARHVRECDVSIDFAEAAAHDAWRGRTGTWERAGRALSLCRELRVETTMVVVGAAQTLTEDNLTGLLRLAEQHGVAVRLNIYLPTFGDRSFIPEPEAIRLALTMLQRWSPAVRSSDRLLGRAGKSTGVHRSCRILPDGTVTPSTYLLGAAWQSDRHLPDFDLAELSQGRSFQTYASPPLPRACRGCDLEASCGGGSVERRWLWAGSLEEPDPLCPALRDGGHAPGAAHSEPGTSDEWCGPRVHLDYLPTIVALPPGASG